MVYKSKTMLANVVDHATLNKHVADINYRRSVLVRVIESIELIGRQGLAFRGKRNEALYKLYVESLNHGNFLQIKKLVAKFDVVLESHLARVFQKSKMALQRRRSKHDKKCQVNTIAYKQKSKTLQACMSMCGATHIP